MINDETAEQRAEREMADLRERGILEKSVPTISRSTLDLMSPKDQAAFFKAGGKISTEDPPIAKQPLPKGAIRRSTFDAMDQIARRDFCLAGGKIVDDEDVAGPGHKNSSTLTREEYRALKLTEAIEFLDNGGSVTD